MKLTLQLLIELAAMERRFNDLYDMAYANYPQSQELILGMTSNSNCIASHKTDASTFNFQFFHKVNSW